MVDFSDPASIARWLAINPEKHFEMLDGMLRLPLFADFWDTMREAVQWC